MNGRDSIKESMKFSLSVLKSYFSDLSDADLLKRPGQGCNHLAWQLGHLIASEASLLEMVAPGSASKLPADFAPKHSNETVGSEDASNFYSKQQYLDLFEQVRVATEAALDRLTDADLDQPGPESMRSFCPTVGSMYILIALHPMMHAGQFVPVRRALGKPILM